MLDLLENYTKELDKTVEHVIDIEQLNGRSVLVAGATGTIGSWIVATLLRYNDSYGAGIRVYGTSRNSKQSTWAKREDFIWLTFDLTKDIEFDVDVDYIIHAAGNGFPSMFYEKPVETTIGTVDGTARLLEYSRIHGAKRLLYISSGEVYGQVETGQAYFTEDTIGKVDTLSPRASYPLSKRMAENLCISCNMEYGTDVVIGRCCHTFGPVFLEKDNRAHAQFIRKAQEAEDIVLNSKGENFRSYLYVGDTTAALLTVMINGNSAEAYNICDKANVSSIRELAEMFAKAAGTKVIFNIEDDEKRNATPITRQTMDDGKLKALGWKSAFSLEQACESVCRNKREKVFKIGTLTNHGNFKRIDP